MKSNFYTYKIFGTLLFILSTTFLFAQKINLLDYLPYAITESKQTFINPTDDGSKSFLGMGWGPINTPKNKNIASRWIVGQKATLTINQDHVQERYFFICIKGLPNTQNQQLELMLNDIRIAAISLNSSFTIYHVTLPASAQKIHENKITLQFNVFSKLLSSDLAPKGIKNEIPLTAAVRWVAISDDNEINYDLETHYPTDFYAAAQPPPSVIIKSSQKVSFYEKIPPHSTLHFISSSFPAQIASTASFNLELKNLSISSAHSFSVRSAKEFIIPLTAFENTITRISFSMPDNISHKIVSIKLIEPAIIHEKHDELVSVSERETIAKAKNLIHNNNLILISLDAASAFHFKSYGYFRETTPFLDKLSAEGIMVSNAFANASYTLASVSSLFTGLLPMSHGIIDQNDALPDNAMLLPEYFHQAGFKTAAFGGNYFVSHIFGFNQGFDYFYEPPVKELQMHSSMIIDKAEEWIDNQKNDKFFMYIHFREPHVPYIPLAPYDSIFWNKSNPSIDVQALKKIKCTDLHQRSPQEIEFLISQYDGLLYYIDKLIEKFYDYLRTKGLLENTMIIVLADHGQSFWKHSIHTHSLQVYDDTIKIPLIITFPQALQIKPHKINNLVETIDILPTLLDLYSISPSAVLPGKSLKNCLLINQCDNKNFITSRNESTTSTLYALRDLNYKFIVQRYRNNEELYYLITDPDEKQNIAKKYPILSAYFLQMLQKTFSDSQKYRYFSPTQSHLNGEIIEKLKALGYVD